MDVTRPSYRRGGIDSSTRVAHYPEPDLLSPDSTTIFVPAPSPSPDEKLELYPRESAITRMDAMQHPSDGDLPAPLPTLNNSVTRKAREAFATTLSPRVQAMLNQKFGKENLTQCFKSEACLRHVLLPLWKSGFVDGESWCSLASASQTARTLLDLIKEYGDVDFNVLQGYPKGWADEKELNEHRIRMSTAALLFFDGDAAALVRWIGGPHVGQHRDPDTLIPFLRGKIDPDVLDDLERILRHGIPSQCNAEATEANFQAFLRYGNHSTVDLEPEKTYQGLVKDHRKSYVLAFDRRIVHFVLNCHLTPQGMVDLDHPYKNPRPIFDSSFRPSVWCYAINDWTTKDTEPELIFGESFMLFLWWIYNLRVTCPTEEICPMDDDMSGAFRHTKCAPNLVAMHSSVQSGRLVMNAGGTFGDNTAPGNFEPISRARQQLAQFLWQQPGLLKHAQPHMPQFRLAPPPTQREISEFAIAEPDELNPGVLDDNGNRLPPQFNHHVDDNLYADVREHVERTLASSVIALYEILGYPSEDVPDPVSQDKLNTLYNHLRTACGHGIDTRALSVDLLEYKREQIVALLLKWLRYATFTLKEASQLHGLLESITRYNKWGRAWFFGLQNAIRHELRKRYHQLLRWYGRSGRAQRIRQDLPAALLERLSQLIAKDMALLLWTSGAKMNMTPEIRLGLQALYEYLSARHRPWKTPIAFIIKRVPHFVSLGDASEDGGGAYCDSLEFWFDIIWSDKVKLGLKAKPGDRNYVHINSLEFIVVILQLIAVILRLQNLTPAERSRLLPNGQVPYAPVLLSRTDNTSSESWANRVTAKSLHGQRLLGVFAELLRLHNVGINCKHIEGLLNVLADFISRPTHFDLSHPERCEQIFQKHDSMRTWSYFLPSPELLQLLGSCIFNNSSLAVPSLPKNLGQFVPAGCSISSSPQI